MFKKKLHKTEVMLLIAGFLIFITMALGVIFAMSFVSGNILKALSSDLQTGGIIRFDIEEYNKLGL